MLPRQCRCLLRTYSYTRILTCTVNSVANSEQWVSFQACLFSFLLFLNHYCLASNYRKIPPWHKLVHPQARHHFWVCHLPQKGSWLCKMALVPREWPCKSSAACVGWHSLGITARTFPRDKCVVDSRSECLKHRTGWKVLPFHSGFFFLTPLNTASGWCQAPASCLPGVTQFGQMAEGKWSSGPSSMQQHPRPPSHLKQQVLTLTCVEWANIFPTALCFWKWLRIGHTLILGEVH